MMRQLSGFYPQATDQVTLARLAQASSAPLKAAELYALLRAYYANNGLYEALARALHEAGIHNPAMRGLRNPAFRVVEFYVAAVWPGPLATALPVRADNERIVAPIERVWAWSNWGAKKQVAARWCAMLGDLFVKVVENERQDRVYFQLVDPAYVTDFDTDERGFVTYCRIDVPVQRRVRDALRTLTHTEVWSKADQSMRRWEHEHGDRPVGELGTPLEEIPFSALGIDFVPVVHSPFRDVGELRGVGAYTLQVDKIDEANRKATRFAQMLFRHNNPTWAIEGARSDASGRPLPPLQVRNDGTVEGAGEIRLGDERMLSLPGGYTLKDLVPDVDFRASLDAVMADLADLQQDLPEMAYWRITEAGTGDLSGRALRFLLTPAISRVEEARGNLLDALARADAMALTMGAARGHFKDLGGTFDSGAFEHGFDCPDVIPLSELEEAQASVQWWTAAKLQKDAGVSRDRILEERGYSEEEIAAMAQQREADQGALNEALGTLLDRQPGATVPVNGAQPNGRPPVQMD